LVSRVADRLAQQAFRQDQGRLCVQPSLERFQQRHAVLLPQPVGVVGSRLAIGQFCPGQGLDLIHRLEVLKRLQRATTGFLLLPLVRVDEQASRMGHASEVGHAFERAPSAVAISHQHAIVAREKHLRILLPAPRLVVEQHHRLFAVRGAAVSPHVRLALRRLAFFLENLHRRLVAVNQRPRQQCLAHRFVQPAVVQLGRPDDPFR